MRRIIFLTQSYDPDATILGVTRDWVPALAARCAGVDVIAQSAPRPQASQRGVRVFSLGKERGAGKARQVVSLYRALSVTLPGAGAVLVHMVPRYAVLAAPMTAAAGRPLALWYAQGGIDRNLRLAARLVTRIVTPTRDSFPLSGPAIDHKVAVTGHGIDTARFSPIAEPPASPPRILAAGRLSPSKRYERLLDALAQVRHHAWRLRIAGGPLYDSDRAYEVSLREHIRRLGLAERVELTGPVAYDAISAEYRAAWLLGHTSATGSLDKVVLEAMACGTPPVSTAPSARGALGPLADMLWCDDGAPEALTQRLEGALAWPAERRAEIGRAARRRVEAHHSLDRWADQVIELLLRPPRGFT